ncbi:MAG: copper resistance D family protein [Gemmatimonadales bacterium]
MPHEPLLHWPEPILAYLEFVAAFLAVGAIGFRYFIVRQAAPLGDTPNVQVYAAAAQRAALLGMVGTLLGMMHLVTALPRMAERLNTTVIGAVTGSLVPGAWVAFTLVALLGFVIAAADKPIGWPLAAIGVVGAALREALAGHWARLINPVHLLAGGFWIGTLFVMLVAGLGVVLTHERARDRRTMVVDMVNAFSPLALVSAGMLVLFGGITAWRHLKRLDALLTTPYGWALIAKLSLVAVVFVLGAWNWRRQRPRLGTDEGAHSIRRSATAELVAAGVVLAATAILVSLPAPK